MITDAQVHLYKPDSPENPWPKDPWRPNPGVKGWTADQMVAAMTAVGVDRAVIVPPAWESDKQETAFEACRLYPGRFKIMGRFDPFDPNGPQNIETWMNRPDTLGIRLAFLRWAGPSVLVKEVLDDHSIDWFWAACERLNIPLMILTQEKPAGLAPIAQRHPKLTLIVDHVATIAGDTVEASFVALDDLIDLARFPNVFVKVSDAANRTKQKYPFADVHPFARRLYDAYGSRRLMWAADITVLPPHVKYAEAFRMWTEDLSFISDDDKEWIMGRTVAEVLNWPEK